ncbi:hypothetical protein G5714_004448 [Onychostoma macrolepis]|uniref:Uncharacterized protein n=1 Tax=Onychostoma macrolepis TaxID=369639 RepID=A0A7J6D585_9TELE|nr:hypothetical protein G5714_004448 [Onychostoma macrolepis]
MDSDVLVLCLLRQRRKRLQRTRLWVHPILQSWNEQGAFHSLIQELRLDEDHHKEYFWLSTTEFDRLLTMVAPLIEKQDTTLRQAIGPAEHLEICLRCFTECSWKDGKQHCITREVLATREKYREYFNSPCGEVPWQYNQV